jgi:hypothetical protein
MDNTVSSLAWDGTYLYAGGLFTTAGGVPVEKAARWDGTNWYPLGSGVSSISHLAWSGETLYASAGFETGKEVTSIHVAQLIGENWLPLGGEFDDGIWALYANGNDLYVGGPFNDVGGTVVNGIARWSGTSWVGVGGGVSGDYRRVTGFQKRGNDLYISGKFTAAGGVPANNVARWNGISWSAVGSGVGEITFDLAWVNDVLFVGGFFFDTGSGLYSPKIAKWENSSWQPVDEGEGIDIGSLVAMKTDGSNVYAAGSFQYAGTTSENRIGRWNGNNWAPLGTGIGLGTTSYVWDLLWAGDNLYAGALLPGQVVSI